MIILPNNACDLLCSRYIFGTKEVSVCASKVNEGPDREFARGEDRHACQACYHNMSIICCIWDENSNVMQGMWGSRHLVVGIVC